jgi:serine/threonine protein phosphatase 1
MLRALKAKMLRKPPEPAVPPGLRVYAVGDIHGRLDLLDDLLTRIAVDDDARERCETHVVFLGDLIDRGAESAGVVQRLRDLKLGSDRVHLIMGNHEEMMLAALEEPRGRSSAMRLFFQNGGRETLLSYGVAEADCQNTTFDELRTIARERVPAEHLDMLRGMKPWVAFGDYLFVHAGVRPGVALEEQRETDLRWIRGEFLRARELHQHVVVHGHSIAETVEFRPNRIGIDTGAYATGRLSAVGLEGADRWVIEAVGAPGAGE